MTSTMPVSKPTSTVKGGDLHRIVVEAIRIHDRSKHVQNSDLYGLISKSQFSQIECQAVLLRCMLVKNGWALLIKTFGNDLVPDPLAARRDYNIASEWALWPKLASGSNADESNLFLSRVNDDAAKAAFQQLVEQARKEEQERQDKLDAQWDKYPGPGCYSVFLPAGTSFPPV